MHWKQKLSYFVMLTAMFISINIAPSLSQGEANSRNSDLNILDAPRKMDLRPGQSLKGTVLLSEKFPQVPAYLLPGNKYPDYDSSRIQWSDNWVRIPSWLAGVWKSEIWIKDGGQIIFNPFSVTEGAERDSEGQIWSYSYVPFDGAPIDKSHKRQCDFVEQYQSSEQLFIYSCHCVSSSIDDKLVITRTWQEENFTCFSPNKDGTLSCLNYVQLFDQDGKKSIEFEEKSQLHLVEAFERSPDKSLQENFEKFLVENGLKRLVPVK